MEVQRNQKAGYCETCDQCDYEIEYADHSSSMGVLATDNLLLMVANGSLTKLNFIFGYILLSSLAYCNFCLRSFVVKALIRVYIVFKVCI